MKLTLFIAGRSGNSETALLNLQKIKQSIPLVDSDITIVDVIEHPETAEERKVLFTPLLEISNASSRKTIVGNLKDIEKVSSIIKTNTFTI